MEASVNLIGPDVQMNFQIFIVYVWLFADKQCAQYSWTLYGVISITLTVVSKGRLPYAPRADIPRAGRVGEEFSMVPGTFAKAFTTVYHAVSNLCSMPRRIASPIASAVPGRRLSLCRWCASIFR